MSEQDKDRGLHAKFRVERVDPEAQERHKNCRVFVLEPAHDPHARVALGAYIESVRVDHPLLAADLGNWLLQLRLGEPDR